MNPTASSMAKVTRSVSMGDGLHLSEPTEDPALTSASCSPPPLITIEPISTEVATPLHAAVIPVVVSLSSSLGSHGNQAALPPRSLQARVPGGNRPLPDKPSLASLSSSSRPLPASVSPLTPPIKDPEPQRDDSGLDSSSFMSSLPVSVCLITITVSPSQWRRCRWR